MARTSKSRGKSNFKIKSPYPLVLGIGAGLMANKQMKRQKRKNRKLQKQLEEAQNLGFDIKN